MFKRTIISALATAAVVGGVLIVKALKKNGETKEETNEEEEDDGIHFITIEDGEEEEEVPAEEPVSEELSEAVKEVCSVYPYLTAEFVEGILKTNEQFNAQYEDDTLVTLTHAAAFPDPSGEAHFLEIMLEAGYECTEEQNTITSEKKFFKENGAIVSDILNVANQAAALGGTYKDYNVA